MKILCICSGTKSIIVPFITEQMEEIRALGNNVVFFKIKYKGILGYLYSAFLLLISVFREKPDILHAHYGLSGLIASFVFWKKKVLTLHGSDVHIRKIRRLSKIASKYSNATIYVSQELANKINIANKNDKLIIPCGINLNLFKPMNKDDARKILKLDLNKRYILFSSSFDNSVKNYPLAKKAIDQLKNDAYLIEMKGYTRTEVSYLLNAVDLLLMTSKSEGSPQIIKEALACNTPIISVDVGTVKEMFEGVDGVSIVKRDSIDIAKEIDYVLKNVKKTNGHKKVQLYDNKLIAKQVQNVYYSTLNNKRFKINSVTNE